MGASADARLRMTSLASWVCNPCCNVEVWLLFCFWCDHVVLGISCEKPLVGSWSSGKKFRFNSFYGGGVCSV